MFVRVTQRHEIDLADPAREVPVGRAVAEGAAVDGHAVLERGVAAQRARQRGQAVRDAAAATAAGDNRAVLGPMATAAACVM